METTRTQSTSFQIINTNSPASDLVFSEMDRWDNGHIDIETVFLRLKDYEKDKETLKDKLKLLEKRIKVSSSDIPTNCFLTSHIF